MKKLIKSKYFFRILLSSVLAVIIIVFLYHEKQEQFKEDANLINKVVDVVNSASIEEEKETEKIEKGDLILDIEEDFHSEKKSVPLLSDDVVFLVSENELQENKISGIIIDRWIIDDLPVIILENNKQLVVSYEDYSELEKGNVFNSDDLKYLYQSKDEMMQLLAQAENDFKAGLIVEMKENDGKHIITITGNQTVENHIFSITKNIEVTEQIYKKHTAGEYTEIEKLERLE